MPKYEDTIPCQAPGCTRKTSPLTVKNTGGFCRDCWQSRPDEWKAFIEARQRTVDPFKGMSDPIEIIMTMHRSPNDDVFIKELDYPISQDALCAGLTSADASRLVEHIVSLLGSNQSDIACSIATSVKLMTSHSLNPFLNNLLSKNCFDCSPSLFIGSTPEIRDELIRRVDEDPNFILSALAWIGDSVTVKQFAVWSAQKPKWTNQLFCSLSDYSVAAGWELSAKGERRDLCSNLCVPLVPFESSHATPALEVFVDAPGTCPSCQRPLVYMFDADASEQDFKELSVSNRRLRFLCCEACVWPAGALFTEISSSGDSRWCKANNIGNASPNLSEPAVPRKRLRMGVTRRNPHYACQRVFESGISQIGGYPSWLQDPQYPTCPGCHQTMFFFGQVAYEDIDPDWEGIFYSFTCTECDRYLAVSYQAT